MQITVKDNIKEFTRWLNGVQRKQVPYASSRALNDTAVDAQKSVQKHAQHTFKNRKVWWKKQQPTGIKVKFSRKDDLTAQVFTRAHFAQLQESGGVKTAHRAPKLLIPTAKVPKKYRKSTGARQMLNERSNVFINQKGVFRRKGKKKIELMWSKAPSARIKPRFDFAGTITKVVNRRFQQHFSRWLEKALSTAKKPSRRR